MLYQIVFAIWGCMQELTPNCQDMTNASSTYLGIVIGAIIGGLITWWVYNRQNKTAKMQDKMLNKIADLEKIHIKILERIEALDKDHDTTLQHILKVDEKVEKEIEERKKEKEDNT